MFGPHPRISVVWEVGVSLPILCPALWWCILSTCMLQTLCRVLREISFLFWDALILVNKLKSKHHKQVKRLQQLMSVFALLYSYDESLWTFWLMTCTCNSAFYMLLTRQRPTWGGVQVVSGVSSVLTLTKTQWEESKTLTKLLCLGD